MMAVFARLLKKRLIACYTGIEMSKDLKSASISGLLYRFMERILAQLVSTVVTIVLARILLPDEYGVVSLITIFITICNVLVTDGLSSALIQKKEPTQLDYSTIFWSSFVLSLGISVVLFFCAPFVAEYFKKPLIVPIFRLMLLRVPLAAINSTQSAYVSKNLLFKKFFLATLTGTIISGILGIILAYNGYGPWALAIQYLSNSLIDTVFLFFSIKWIPSFEFSWKAFKSLFSFGWKVLISGLVGELYEELRSFIIAKQYSTADLSFYTKGKQFPQLLGDNVSSTITNVLFPIYSTAQDEPAKLRDMFRISISVACYILCPLMVGFAVVARQFVIVVLTPNWAESIPYIRIFCIMYILKPLKNINKSSLKAMKRSDLDLIVNIIEKTLGISLVIVLMKKGTIYLAISALVTYFVATAINMIVNGKFLGYHFIDQVKDTGTYFGLALLACLPAIVFDAILGSTFLCLIIQITSACIIYLFLSETLKIWPYEYIKSTILEKLRNGSRNR